MTQAVATIVMGSASEWPIIREAAALLDQFHVAHEVTVSSAHRAPQRTAALARHAAERGVKMLIAGAGGAAHAAILATQILALSDTKLAERLQAYKEELAAKVARDADALQARLREG